MMSVKKKATLFEIEEKYINLINSIEENDGLLTDETEQELAIVEEEFKAKCRAYGVMHSHLTGDIALLKDRKKSFDAQIKRIEATQKRLVDRLIPALQMFGDTTKTGNHQYKDEFVSLTTRNNQSASGIEADADDFGKYSIMNIDLHLSKAELQEVFKFIDEKFGKDKCHHKGTALKKKLFMDNVKKSIVIKKIYAFDANNDEVSPIVDGVDNPDVVSTKTEYFDTETNEVIPNATVVESTSLTIK